MKLWHAPASRFKCKILSSDEVRERWRAGQEIALLDVREEMPFAEAHPFFAVSLPLSQIELRVMDLIPRLSAPIVVYDDGEGLAAEAARRIAALGYSDVAILEGGLSGYRAVGEVFRDVNVPSKAFGELVESIHHTPALSASEVKAKLEAGADMVILDARRFEEYHAMNIPGGISVPGGELVLRSRDLVASPETLVLVNCAGRTRSIIGAQSLINAGIPNPVAALRNGTIGWTLAGYSLVHGQTRSFGESSRAAQSWAQEASRRLAAKTGVTYIDIATLDRWIANAKERTLYCLDVRSPEEYESGHPAGFQSAPGGQLVQALDEWVGVRGARLVLFSNDQVRATMTASWLVQMGWEAVVIEPGALALDQKGPPMPRRPEIAGNAIDFVTAETLACTSGVSATVVDLARSPQYLRGHIPGARFAIRSRFAIDLPELEGTGTIVLTSPDGCLAAHASADAALASRRPIKVLKGGTRAWIEAGQPLERSPHWVSPQIDVYKRPYEGTDNTAQAMEDYIAWELQLVAQLANDGVCRFRVIR